MLGWERGLQRQRHPHSVPLCSPLSRSPSPGSSFQGRQTGLSWSASSPGSPIASCVTEAHYQLSPVLQPARFPRLLLPPRGQLLQLLLLSTVQAWKRLGSLFVGQTAPGVRKARRPGVSPARWQQGASERIHTLAWVCSSP